MFKKFEKEIGTPKDYLQQVFQSLSSPGKDVPPLILFHGRDLGLKQFYYSLNPKFFIENEDSHFFDDVWFCLKCRDRRIFGGAGDFCIETLVDRKACGMTLWKDWSQFTQFLDKCIGEARQSNELATKVAGDSVEVLSQGFLDELWHLMREGEFPETARQKMIDRAKDELRKIGNGSLRALIRIANWSLFGNLRDKEIVGKTGGRDFLIKHSSLLRKLSELKDEIPFYVFVIGSAKDLEKVKKSRKTMEKLLTIIAKAFISTIVDCFDAVEIKGAWDEAKKQGS
jgi:hypothetical protein